MQPVRSKLVHLLRLNKESLGHRLLRTISTFILIDFRGYFSELMDLKSLYGLLSQFL